MITKSPDKTHAKPFVIAEERLLSLPKMLQVMAYVQRFITRLRKIATPEGPMSAEQMEVPRMKWWKCPELQDKHCPQVINGAVTIKKEVSKDSIEPKTGYRWNRQMLWKTEKRQLIRKDDHTNSFSKKRKFRSTVG